jgi:hypothetical protein
MALPVLFRHLRFGVRDAGALVTGDGTRRFVKSLSSYVEGIFIKARGLRSKRGLTAVMSCSVTTQRRVAFPPAESEAAGDNGTDCPSESHDGRGRYHLGGCSGQAERSAGRDQQADGDSVVPEPDDQGRRGERGGVRAQGAPRAGQGHDEAAGRRAGNGRRAGSRGRDRCGQRDSCLRDIRTEERDTRGASEWHQGAYPADGGHMPDTEPNVEAIDLSPAVRWRAGSCK